MVIGSRVESDFQAYALALEKGGGDPPVALPGGNTDAVPKPAFGPDLPYYSNTLRLHVAGSMVSGLVPKGSRYLYSSYLGLKGVPIEVL